MNKRILQELRSQLRKELNDASESTDYKRGIRSSMLIFCDILNDEGKTSLAEIIDTLSI